MKAMIVFVRNVFGMLPVSETEERDVPLTLDSSDVVCGLDW
jgi:hypothetical protein